MVSQRVGHTWATKHSVIQVVFTWVCCCCLVAKLCLTPLRPHETARFFCLWDFPGKKTGMGCHFLLQGIFPTLGSNLCFLHCRWILYHWATCESCSVQLSSVVSDYGLQQARLLCPLSTSRAYANSYPLTRWCQPTILSSVFPFLSSPQSYPESGSFQISQFFTSGGQSIVASASASVLPMNTQDWFPLGWTGWISLPSKGFSRVFSNTTV